jgi:signal recognition particle subunit SEC65
MRSMWLSTEKVDLLTLQYTLTVVSRCTAMPYLDPKRVEVLETAYRLSLSGMSTRDITEELNRLGYKPQSVERFYPKLVWMMLKKYRYRIARSGNYHIENITEKVLFS